MTWRALSLDDLHAVLTGPEVSAIGAAAVGGGIDAVEGQRDLTTATFRGAIQVSQPLGDADTLPEGFVWYAAVFWRHALLGRVPGIRETDIRRTEYDEAQRILRDFRRGDIVLTDPAGGAAESPARAGNVEVISADTTARRNLRSQTDGLL